MTRLFAVAALAATLSAAQSPTFEVASIRPPAEETSIQAGVQISPPQARFYDFTPPLTPQHALAMRLRAGQAAGAALPAEALRFLDTASIDSPVESLATIGVTLQSRRAPLGYLVVDHIEKTPSEV